MDQGSQLGGGKAVLLEHSLLLDFVLAPSGNPKAP